jgi:NitT/TauT family transport system permease protein
VQKTLEPLGRLSDAERVALVQRQKRWSSYFYMMLSIIGVLTFLIIWQFAVMADMVPRRFLSTPIEVINLFLVKLTDPFPDGAVLGINILSSLSVALTGFGLAIIIGIPLGLFMGWYRGFDAFMRPIFEIVRPIPPVSWIPLTIIWLGIGLQAKAFIVFFAAFVPCLINAYTGIRQTNQVLINVAKTCGASNFTIFYRIGIPSSFTMLFAGIRIALGNSWATLVAAEMLAASAGLGFMILMGRQFARPDLIILGIVVIGSIGVLLTFFLGLFENRILGWKKL